MTQLDHILYDDDDDDDDDDDGLVFIPHFWYATTLFRPVKGTPKSA